MTAQELGMLSMVPKYMVMALLHTMLQGTSVNMTPMNIVPLQKKQSCKCCMCCMYKSVHKTPLYVTISIFI